MPRFDLSMSLTILGLGASVVFGLIPQEWRDTHPQTVGMGLLTGILICGVGIYPMLLDLMLTNEGNTMLPKASMAIGIILLLGGAMCEFSSKGSAQMALGSNASNHVVGATIVGNGGGGTAAEISSTGFPGQSPSVGAHIDVHAMPGQSVTGLSVMQNGLGTGLRVIQSGPGTGMKITVGVSKSAPGE